MSTSEQDLGLQLEALRGVGCRDEQVFLDTASGAHTARPGLDACVQALAPGDTLVVWRLDRLGRSMVHLVTVIEELLRRQVGFRSTCFPHWRSLNGGSFRSAHAQGWPWPEHVANTAGANHSNQRNHGCRWPTRCMGIGV